MINYIFKRILLGLISLFALLIIVFFLLNATGIEPLNETDFNGDKTKFDDAKKAVGLDLNVIDSFGRYIKDTFGPSPKFGRFGAIYKPSDAKTITDLFFSPLKYTIAITSISFLLSVLIGVTLGFIAGYNSGKLLDNVINFIVVMFMAVPTFIFAAIMLIIGPKIGLITTFLNPSTYGSALYWKSIIIPIIILTVTSLSGFTYYTRNEIKSILVSDYITNARSKGMGEFSIFRKYVFRNALIPIISIVVPGFVIILSGSLVVETFFSVPGISTILIDAIKNNESNVVMFNVLFFGSISISLRILVDILYLIIDPRIKFIAAKESQNSIFARTFKTLSWTSKIKKAQKKEVINGK